MSDFFLHGPSGFMTALAHPIDTGNALVDAEQAALAAAAASMARGATRVEEGAAHVVAGTARIAGQTAATASRPMADALSDVGQGMQATAGFLSLAADRAGKISRDVLIGELVLAGVTVLGVGAALWLGRQPISVIVGKAMKAAL